MGDVAQEVQPADALPLEQVDGVGVALAVEGDEDVAAVDLVLAARLHLHRGPLQHPGKGAGLLRVAIDTRRQGDEDPLQVFLELAAQFGHPGAAGAEDARGDRIPQQRVEEVLEGDVLVPARLGLREGQPQRRLQFLGDAQSHVAPV